MNPQQNINKVNNLIDQIKNHPMCANFNDDGYYYTVIYPLGFNLDGARANYYNGKGIALERLLSAIERHWNESIIK